MLANAGDISNKILRKARNGNVRRSYVVPTRAARPTRAGRTESRRGNSARKSDRFEPGGGGAAGVVTGVFSLLFSIGSFVKRLAEEMDPCAELFARGERRVKG